MECEKETPVKDVGKVGKALDAMGVAEMAQALPGTDDKLDKDGGKVGKALDAMGVAEMAQALPGTDDKLDKVLAALDTSNTGAGDTLLGATGDSIVDTFISNLSQTFGLQCKSEFMQKGVTLLSTYAVGEFCQNVLCIGGGASTGNLTSLQLAQIKQKLEEINVKMDALSESPVKTSWSMMQKGLIRLENSEDSEQRLAKEDFHTANIKAEEGFQIFTKQPKEEDLPLLTMATQVKIMTDILRSAWDETKHVFVPYALWSAKKKHTIGQIIKKHVDQLIDTKMKIKPKFTKFTKAQKITSNAKIQDKIDEVLRRFYPYIEHTFAPVEASPSKIFTIPKYLPEGVGDCLMQTLTASSGQSQSVLMWRLPDFTVCASLGEEIVEIPVNDNEEVVEIEVIKEKLTARGDTGGGGVLSSDSIHQMIKSHNQRPVLHLYSLDWVKNLEKKEIRGHFHWSCIYGCDQVAGHLINNVNVDTTAKYDDWLHLAAGNGRDDIARLLLSTAGDNIVHAKSSAGYTPLAMSATYGHLSTCKLLLQHGAVKGDARSQAGAGGAVNRAQSWDWVVNRGNEHSEIQDLLA